MVVLVLPQPLSMLETKIYVNCLKEERGEESIACVLLQQKGGKMKQTSREAILLDLQKEERKKNSQKRVREKGRQKRERGKKERNQRKKDTLETMSICVHVGPNRYHHYPDALRPQWVWTEWTNQSGQN